MNRKTDKKTAALIRRNAEALQKAGVEPSKIDMMYADFAAAEDKIEEQEIIIASKDNEIITLRAALQRQSENNREYD